MSPSNGRNSFGKECRLHRQRNIDSLFKQGRWGSAYPFRYCYWLASNESDKHDEGDESTNTTIDSGKECNEAAVSILVSVPKRHFKRANRRNLLRRRTKEAFRINRNELESKCRDKGLTIRVALVYCQPQTTDYKTIENGVKKVLDALGKNL